MMRASAVGLLGALALAPGACGGGDDAPTGPRTTTAQSTGTSAGSTGGEGGAGGTGGSGASSGAGGGCGNGVAQPGEICDGDDLRGITCDSLGFSEGALRCADDCTLDRSGCSGAELCYNGRDDDGDGNVDCDDEECAGACANPCGAPPVLTDPSAVSGSVVGHAPLTGSCADPEGGPAVVYQFTATKTGILSAYLSAPPDADLSVAIRTTCADADTELACAANPAGAGEDDVLSVPVSRNDRVYVVVQGYSATQETSYELQIGSHETVCGDGIVDPTEECDVLGPRPNDGCSDDCRLELTETEPNDTSAAADAYAAPYFGAIDPFGDEDVVRVSVTSGPILLVASTGEINPAGCANGQIDSVVEILDGAGNVLARDDNGGDGLCSSAVAPGLAAGSYFVRISAAVGGSAPTFPYRLDIAQIVEVCGDGNVTAGEQCDDGNTRAGDGCSPACRFELTESEPNGVSAQADAYTSPWLAEIAPAGDVDVVAVDVPGPSSTLNATISDNGTDACMAGLLDSFIEILAPDGSTVLASDNDAGIGFCSDASVSGLAAGRYFVRVRSAPVAPGATFFYRLNATLL